MLNGQYLSNTLLYVHAHSLNHVTMAFHSPVTLTLMQQWVAAAIQSAARLYWVQIKSEIGPFN